LIASSANVYGNISGRELSEDICPAPVNHYAASKLAMEHMVRTWFDRVPIIMTRPFNYTGPGQDERFVVPKIVNHFKRRASSIQLGDTSVERDFSDVEDLVEAYMRLLESDARSEIVNICSGKTVSVAAIVAEMNRIAGYEIKVETQPALLRKNDINRLVGNNQKLRRLTGFAPSTGIRETLLKMYAA
jgi:nucleoside-diphosphate-sugar epimerase